MNMIEKDSMEKRIEVGRWKISDQLGILASPEGKSMVLEPRLSKLLYLLSEHQNQVVSREYLIDHMWKDIVVNEESLTRAIADLRKTLSENFETFPDILTLRKRGYQMVFTRTPKMIALKWKVKKRDLLVLAGIGIGMLLYWLS